MMSYTSSDERAGYSAVSALVEWSDELSDGDIAETASDDLIARTVYSPAELLAHDDAPRSIAAARTNTIIFFIFIFSPYFKLLISAELSVRHRGTLLIHLCLTIRSS